MQMVIILAVANKDKELEYKTIRKKRFAYRNVIPRRSRETEEKINGVMKYI